MEMETSFQAGCGESEVVSCVRRVLLSRALIPEDGSLDDSHHVWKLSLEELRALHFTRVVQELLCYVELEKLVWACRSQLDLPCG